MGLHSELPAAGPWTGPGAVCSGGPRSHCQKWLCGAVHCTFHKPTKRCLQRFLVHILKQSSLWHVVCNCAIYSFFSGYRHVHLLKADGSSLSPATLFIHVKITRKGVPIKTVSERMAIAKGKAWCACEPNGWQQRALEKELWMWAERERLLLLLPAGLAVQISSGPIYTEPLPSAGRKMSFIRDEEARWLLANELPQAG